MQDVKYYPWPQGHTTTVFMLIFALRRLVSKQKPELLRIFSLKIFPKTKTKHLLKSFDSLLLSLMKQLQHPEKSSSKKN